jgi:uncharacterized protein YdeI (BOF family)
LAQGSSLKNNLVEVIFDLKEKKLKTAFIEKIFKQSYAFVKEAYEITVILDRLKWNQMKLDIKPKKDNSRFICCPYYFT